MNEQINLTKQERKIEEKTKIGTGEISVLIYTTGPDGNICVL